MTLKPGCVTCEHVADVRGIDPTQPTPEAKLANLRAKVDALAFEWAEKADDAEGMAISRSGLSDEAQLRAFATVMRRRSTELRALLEAQP